MGVLRCKSLSLRHAPDTARTCNLQFRRLSLYPVELRVLYIAEVDHMAQPGFGKAKMQLLKPGDRVRQTFLIAYDAGLKPCVVANAPR